MQPTNQYRAQKSRCVFCNSTDYGKGCRFGPKGVHFHPHDFSKCSYCGSPDFGKGCRLNPAGNLHIHGGVYNNMYKEELHSILDNSVLINELKKDYTEFECYRLGIIDDNGNKIKQPITEAEQLSYSPLTRTILRVKKYLGAKVDLLDAAQTFSRETTGLHESVEQHKKIVQYRERFDSLINEMYKLVQEAQNDGIPAENLKKIIRA
jgi:hypothetical protein